MFPDVKVKLVHNLVSDLQLQMFGSPVLLCLDTDLGEESLVLPGERGQGGEGRESLLRTGAGHLTLSPADDAVRGQDRPTEQDGGGELELDHVPRDQQRTNLPVSLGEDGPLLLQPGLQCDVFGQVDPLLTLLLGDDPGDERTQAGLTGTEVEIACREMLITGTDSDVTLTCLEAVCDVVVHTEGLDTPAQTSLAAEWILYSQSLGFPLLLLIREQSSLPDAHNVLGALECDAEELE